MKSTFLPLLLLFMMAAGFTAKSQSKLNSYLPAAATIYLDFDGQEVNSPVWNNGAVLTCAPAAMNNAQITEVFNRVSEDYRPFNINITTDLDVFLAAPVYKRIRVIITPTSSWFTGVGGVAYVGSFTWGDDTPCFVFCDRLGNNAKMVGECCSHESGHTVGLSHQSKYDASCALTQSYNEGEGAGEVAWAPIMGNSYYRNMSGWNNGPTPYGCSYLQDNLSIITTQNGFTYRADDYPDDINASPAAITANGMDINGLISTSVDKDAFSFTIAQNSSFYLQVNPYSIAANNEGADLDVKLSIYDSAKNLVRIYNPSTSMNVIVDTFLASGKYYLVVEGTGNSNAPEYGSLGSYTMKGLTGILPVKKVSLTGASVNNRHHLNWSIETDERVQSIIVEASVDGRNFSSINTLTASATDLDYTPLQQSNSYYRLKVVSVSNIVTYSNVISLRAIEKTMKVFTVSTFIQNEVSIHAPSNYQYRVFNASGIAIASGCGVSGLNKLNLSRQPGGMYILQLISNSGNQAERIIKQ